MRDPHVMSPIDLADCQKMIDCGFKRLIDTGEYKFGTFLTFLLKFLPKLFFEHFIQFLYLKTV